MSQLEQFHSIETITFVFIPPWNKTKTFWNTSTEMELSKSMFMYQNMWMWLGNWPGTGKIQLQLHCSMWTKTDFLLLEHVESGRLRILPIVPLIMSLFFSFIKLAIFFFFLQIIFSWEKSSFFEMPYSKRVFQLKLLRVIVV